MVDSDTRGTQNLYSMLPEHTQMSSLKEARQWPNREGAEGGGRLLLVQAGGQGPSSNCDVVSLPAASVVLAPRVSR